jgi:hypothetical protein
MDTLNRLSRKGLSWALGFVVIGSALAAGLYFLVIQPAANQEFKEPGQGSGLVEAKGPRDSFKASTGTVFLVPSDAIPKTQAERYTAPSSALLPDRWATSADADEQVGPGADVAKIPYADRQLLIADVQSFLTAWETFKPPDVGTELTAPAAYVARIAPWVEPGYLSQVANRIDDAQGDGVCPDAGCTVGSTFDSTDLWSMSNVRYYDGASAYVTAYGDVTYTADSPENPLEGAVFQRTYGLLLRLENGRWLVTRAAAASDGPIG